MTHSATGPNARQELLTVIAHELRTPLTSIHGYTEVLRKAEAGPLTTPQQRMLEAIARNTARLRYLVDDLLTLYAADNGNLHLALQPVDLQDLLTGALTETRRAAPAAALTLLGHPGPLRVRADPQHLQRVLRELLTNAAKFTPDGGDITVHVTQDSGHAEVRVSDTGIGIPRGDQPHLFTRYFRATNATARELPGAGLGLTVAHEIVTRHQGTLTITPRAHTGTTALLRLPLER